MVRKPKIRYIVRIINPEFFVRSRYEKEFFDFYQEVSENDSEIVDKMMMVFHVPSFLEDIDRAEFRLRDQIIKGIAAYKMEKAKADGAKKVIETTTIAHFLNKRFIVYDYMNVATGEYGKAKVDRDWEGNPDCTPARLTNRKYHIILKVVQFDGVPENQKPVRLMIEDVNVEFLEIKTIDTPAPEPYVWELCSKDAEEDLIEMFSQPPIMDNNLPMVIKDI